MQPATLSFKRQLLTDLLTGNVFGFNAYKANLQKAVEMPYRWIINDEVSMTVHSVGTNGSCHPLSPNDLTKAPKNALWRIVDYSCGKRIPDADEVL